MRTAAQAVGWLMIKFTCTLSYGIASASPVHLWLGEYGEGGKMAGVLTFRGRYIAAYKTRSQAWLGIWPDPLLYSQSFSKSRQFLPKDIYGNLLRYGNQWGKNHNFGILEMAGLGLVGQIGSWAWEAGWRKLSEMWMPACRESSEIAISKSHHSITIEPNKFTENQNKLTTIKFSA